MWQESRGWVLAHCVAPMTLGFHLFKMGCQLCVQWMRISSRSPWCSSLPLKWVLPGNPSFHGILQAGLSDLCYNFRTGYHHVAQAVLLEPEVVQPQPLNFWDYKHGLPTQYNADLIYRIRNLPWETPNPRLTPLCTYPPHLSTAPGWTPHPLSQVDPPGRHCGLCPVLFSVGDARPWVIRTSSPPCQLFTQGASVRGYSVPIHISP